jgi:hypothetical protein
MESSFNITAPPKFKAGPAAVNSSKAMNVFVPQGNDEATAESDSQIQQPRNGPLYNKVTVPQTDTGGWVKYTQAYEWNLVKELGNLAP